MLESLAKTASSFPAIDNHAHNILSAEKKDAFPLHSLAGEGTGEARDDVMHTLSLKTATKHLAALFGCEPTWESVKSNREKLSQEELCKLCFGQAYIQCLLLDDLLIGIEGNCESTQTHKKLINGPVKRIVRLEAVAEVSPLLIDIDNAPL